MKLWKRVRLWMKRREFERDLAEEVRFHHEMTGGAKFGSQALALEDSRAVWGFAWLDSWQQDVRYALRGFRKSPGFALGVVGAIGLGLGLNTTMFTVFNAYVLRPYAVQDPYGLYEFSWYGKEGNGHGFSEEQYDRLRKQKTPFADVLASVNLATQVDGRTLFGQTISGNYFTMLGVGMAYGRPLRPDDSGAVLVLGYEAWRNKFAGDPGLVGRTVFLRGHPFEVVGITNPAFGGLESLPVGFWIPLSMAGTILDGRDLLGRQEEPLSLVGRLAPGVHPEAAKAAMLGWARGFAPDAVGVALFSRATTVPLTRDAFLTFLPIFTAFGLVLLIACANVSNMMLARALARQREVAIRVSLGAGRARLIRQLLTESVLLAIPAALAGMAISEVTVEGARRLLFATLPPAFARLMALADLTPDWRVFGFILLASVATALVFGLAPAIQTTRSRQVVANRGDFSSDYRPARLRSVLVVAQVAVCTLLLISTAIVLRSERRVLTRNIGLETQGVWDLRMVERHQANAAARLTRAGAGTVAAAWHAPLYGWLRHMPVSPSGSSRSVSAGYNFVSPGYFEVFRIPLVRGQDFSEQETEASAPVVVISETTARKFWPHADGLGETIAIPPHPHEARSMDRAPAYAKARVIGVVRDVMSGSIGIGIDDSCIYFPTKFGETGNDSILVRLNGDSANARRRLEAVLDQVAPSLSDFINPMSDVLGVQVYPFRVAFWVAGFLGGVALLMTVSGIYGVMSYLVSQRRKEIGIRVALGAGTYEVVWMVVRQSARLAAIGTALGAGVALTLAPVFAHELEVIRPYEISPYAGSIALVLLAAIAAAFSPSRRAVGIDPVQTLRCD